VPAPAAWSKQVGFIGPDAGKMTGTFFRNDCKQLPADSDWNDEVRNGMRIVEWQRRQAARPAQRIERLSVPECVVVRREREFLPR
jgi:hypothetical protein